MAGNAHSARTTCLAQKMGPRADARPPPAWEGALNPVPSPRGTPMFASNAFQIRAATSSDASTLRRLSELDSRPPVKAPALIGAIDGYPAAVISLVDGRVVADPFIHTDAL